MTRPPPVSTRTDTLFPYTTLFRSRCQRLRLVARRDRRGIDGLVEMGHLDQLVLDMARRLRAIIVGDLRRGADHHVAEPGLADVGGTRSEERRVGKECVSTCRSRCPLYN